MKCQQCFTEENVTRHPERFGDDLCPACAADLALDDAASDHLAALLRPIVQDWAKHWNRVGLTESALTATLEVVGAFWDGAGAAGENVGASALIREALGLDAVLPCAAA